MDQGDDHSDGKSSTGRSPSSWRSVLASLKKHLQFLSPIRCLAMTRDSYVRGMNSFAASSGGMMIQGPHIGALSRNASRSASEDEDDLYQLIRAASMRKSRSSGLHGSGENLGPATLPRSASVQEQGIKFAHRGKIVPRSVSHSAMSRFPRTVLESTQEE